MPFSSASERESEKAVKSRCVKLITNAGSTSHFQFMIWCNYRVSPQFDTSQNHTYAFALSYNKQMPVIKSVSLRIHRVCFRHNLIGVEGCFFINVEILLRFSFQKLFIHRQYIMKYFDRLCWFVIQCGFYLWQTNIFDVSLENKRRLTSNILKIMKNNLARLEKIIKKALALIWLSFNSSEGIL